MIFYSRRLEKISRFYFPKYFLTVLEIFTNYYNEYIIFLLQANRVDNVIVCNTRKEALEKLRDDIRDFKNKSNVDKVIVLWTANTERLCDICVGKNDTADNLLQAIDENYEEISPSTLFAVASILEGVRNNSIKLHACKKY